MAEITGRRRGELVRGVFKVLMDNPDGLPAARPHIRFSRTQAGDPDRQTRGQRYL
jgi:hypothetical protein